MSTMPLHADALNGKEDPNLQPTQLHASAQRKTLNGYEKANL